MTADGQEVLDGKKSQGFTLSLCSLSASEQTQPYKQQCREDNLQSDCRCWVTGKAAAPGKSSFGDINTLAVTLLSRFTPPVHTALQSNKS